MASQTFARLTFTLLFFWQNIMEMCLVIGMSKNKRKALNKLASLEATLVQNSAQGLNDSLTGVKCRATSVARNGLFACLGLALIGLVTLVAVTLDAARNSRLRFRPELAEPFKV